MLGIFGNYKFTRRKHPIKGVMSSIFGIISVLSLIIAVALSVRDMQVYARYAFACILAFVMAIAGEVLGIRTVLEPDTYQLFPRIGMVSNGISILFVIFLVILGVR